MTDNEKSQILQMAESGMKTKAISNSLGLNYQTVKSFLRRSKQQIKPDVPVCKECGHPLDQASRQSSFCSDACRMNWWNKHRNENLRKSNTQYICQNCGKTFTAYSKASRKYCCRSCYMEARFHG